MILIFSILKFSLAEEILIQNARLVDARGDLGIHSILISEQKISAIDPLTVSENIQIIDGSNMSVLPGLIDSHVHISMTPGNVYRNDTPEEKHHRHAWHMKAYLSLGITTIVDTGIPPQDAKIIRELQALGPAPDILIIGPLLSPKDG